MQPVRVYCDTGGYRKELAKLQLTGQVEVLTYAYENSTKKIKLRAPSSNPNWDEGDSTWDTDCGTWEDYAKTSDMWPEIVALLGSANLRDAKHVDSALQGGCDVLLTSDFDDLASKANEVFALTGLRIFHSVKDWDRFLAYVQSAA
jgi:hypothetical protein